MRIVRHSVVRLVKRCNNMCDGFVEIKRRQNETRQQRDLRVGARHKSNQRVSPQSSSSSSCLSLCVFACFVFYFWSFKNGIMSFFVSWNTGGEKRARDRTETQEELGILNKYNFSCCCCCCRRVFLNKGKIKENCFSASHRRRWSWKDINKVILF